MTTGDVPTANTGEHQDPYRAFEASLEHELRTAQRSLTGHLFHYTSADTAIFNILGSGTLRLSPFESTNDLWESRPLHPVISTHDDDRDFDATFDLWAEIDRNIRLHAKVACLTLDVALPDHVFNRDALRGWAHLSLWAHYGAGHAGVCLRFNRHKLIKAFLEHAEPSALTFHGPVGYLSAQGGPATRGIDPGQVKEFGVDAVALAYAEANKESIFFRKHADWANEVEYRLVLLNQSVLPTHIDIREALTGVVLGDAFPQGRLPALLEMLQAYPDVEVEQVRYMNRTLHCYPFDGTVRPGAGGVYAWGAPRRTGSLDERLAALRRAEAESQERRQQATPQCGRYAAAIEQGIAALGSDLQSWQGTEVAVHSHTMAIPETQRSRRPGVLGEQVHLERGFMCVVENLPRPSFTLVAAAAVQVLDGQQLRLHAVVTTEWWDPDGNERNEHWRGTCTTSITDADTAVDTLLTDLNEAVHTTRAAFDHGRGRMSGDSSTPTSEA